MANMVCARLLVFLDYIILMLYTNIPYLNMNKSKKLKNEKETKRKDKFCEDPTLRVFHYMAKVGVLGVPPNFVAFSLLVFIAAL